MGKVVASTAAASTAASPAETTKKRKKKGRPSLLDLKKRALQHSSNPNFNTPNSRSTRRNPNSAPLSPSPNFVDPDDDDERKEKKVKLVVRLPQHSRRSSSLNSASCDSDSNADDAHDSNINAKLTHNTLTPQGEKIAKATNTLHGGSPLESGPTTPLPSRKLLVFILDRLQKKDTHGVFSEPVDPEELPDYHDIIEHPMDFGTVRKKLDKGVYSNLEQLEADVLLICSNAMQYNPPNTVFFRQAKSIQELAKRDFENLRQEGEDGELQPKVVRRGRPPTKHLKKQQQQQPLLGGSPAERVGLECATLATFEDNSIGPSNSNAYNLRRPPPPLHRFHSTDATPNAHRSRNANASADNNNHSEYLSNWNEEFPASILKADMKYGNKQFLLDETRRDTYKEFHPTAAGHEPFALYNVGGDMKQLMAVGLHSEHGYARSLARFAANLGPIVWKVASKKFSSVLPPGVKLGPAGLATENVSSPSHLHRNGFKAGMFGYNNNNNNNNNNNSHSNSSSQVGGLEVTSSHMTPCTTPANKNQEDDDEEVEVEGDLGESSSKGGGGAAAAAAAAGPESGKSLSAHNNKRQYGSGVPPDLNVRIFGPGSPKSSATAALRIASPKQQPDLALQL